jgi:hypothetical protein
MKMRNEGISRNHQGQVLAQEEENPMLKSLLRDPYCPIFGDRHFAWKNGQIHMLELVRIFDAGHIEPILEEIRDRGRDDLPGRGQISQQRRNFLDGTYKMALAADRFEYAGELAGEVGIIHPFSLVTGEFRRLRQVASD